MSRWKINLADDFKLEATPEVEKMLTFVSEASKELTEKIMEAEEKLVLTSISNEDLQRLIDLCTCELSRRKN